MPGALMPVGFATPSSPETMTEIADFLVTSKMCIGTRLVFRFYPQGESYTSPASQVIGVQTTLELHQGQLLRLEKFGADATRLLRRDIGAATWNQAGLATGFPVTTSANSLYVYWASSQCAQVAICGVGLEGFYVPPPVSVLPCKYALTVPAPAAPGRSCGSTRRVRPG